jgi:hypothetical protein
MKAPKLKAMSSAWMPPVGGEFAIGLPHRLELPGLHRDVVDEDGGEHDPPIGKSPYAAPLAAAASASGAGMPYTAIATSSAATSPRQRRHVRAHVREREEPEQHDHRQRRDERAEREAAERGVDLRPAHGVPASRLSAGGSRPCGLPAHAETRRRGGLRRTGLRVSA